MCMYGTKNCFHFSIVHNKRTPVASGSDFALSKKMSNLNCDLSNFRLKFDMFNFKRLLTVLITFRHFVFNIYTFIFLFVLKDVGALQVLHFKVKKAAV